MVLLRGRNLPNAKIPPHLDFSPLTVSKCFVGDRALNGSYLPIDSGFISLDTDKCCVGSLPCQPEAEVQLETLKGLQDFSTAEPHRGGSGDGEGICTFSS